MPNWQWNSQNVAKLVLQLSMVGTYLWKVVYIPICNTKQYINKTKSLSYIILELITMYTLVSGVHVCDEVI